MRCLITGGAGFIGSHLTEYLLAEGNEVVVLDDLSTGDVKNLSDVLSHSSLTFRMGSASDAKVVAEVIEGCEEVYHLAACVGVKLIVDRPLQSMCSNIDASRVVIERAHAIGARLFYASSSEVYGRCASGKALREDDEDCYRWSQSLRWSYANAKAFGEYLVQAFARERGLRAVTGRLFNIAGPRQSSQYGMVIPRFVEQAMIDQPITVYGSGDQLRCFTYVIDAVRAIVQLTRSSYTDGQILNIASGNVVSIRDLAEEVKQLLNSRSTIVHVDPKFVFGEGFEDVLYRLPDINKLRLAIGFQPTAGIQEIVRTTAKTIGALSNTHKPAAHAAIAH